MIKWVRVAAGGSRGRGGQQPAALLECGWDSLLVAAAGRASECMRLSVRSPSFCSYCSYMMVCYCPTPPSRSTTQGGRLTSSRMAPQQPHAAGRPHRLHSAQPGLMAGVAPPPVGALYCSDPWGSSWDPPHTTHKQRSCATRCVQRQWPTHSAARAPGGVNTAAPDLEGYQ
jgi:hypothetical protein